MSSTVRDVLDGIASFVNQDPTLVTSTDLTSQVNYIKRSQDYWGNKYQWKALRRTYALPFTVSMVSVALPDNFKKLMSPVYDVSLNSNNKYIEIDPADRFYKNSTDLYCYVAGNDTDGKALVFNTPAASGASLIIDYQSYPSSLATLQDVVACPSTEFLINYSIYQVLAARSDPRFPTYKAASDELMGDMMEEEAAASGGMENRTRNYLARNNFRPGND
jgi:hypothetical protein